MKFRIRDLLWLTTVIGLALGWGLWIHSLPPPDPKVGGTIEMDGKALTGCEICFHSKSGQIYGSKITDGEFSIPRIPEGNYQISIEGEGIPSRYNMGGQSVSRGSNECSFKLTSR